MQDFIDFLISHNELKIIDTPLDVELEIPHLAYIEVKKTDSKALLFTNPTSKHRNLAKIPVLMNIFGSYNRLNLIATKYNSNTKFKDIESIAKFMKNLLNPKMPDTLFAKFTKLKELMSLKSVPPQRYKKKPVAQSRIYKDSNIDLFSLPILKTWEEDGGAFITMGQIYTRSLDSDKNALPNNLGMYRLQVKSKDELIMHWQIHKDGAHFFHEYKKAQKPMPVSIAIGGDPLYTWCAQAPLPPKIFELMLYGLIRGKRANMAKCISNPLYIPHDSDIVIEGYVDTNHFAKEGKFGDHTGFYTPIEDYPVLKVSAITTKENPIYLATVVGKPPLEDKYMGYMTERLFLPLLQMSAGGLLDYSMPENGVFHNLILAKVKSDYPAQSLQMMHTFFGIGQMSFVKHAIFLSENAPSMHSNFKILTDYILDRIDSKKLYLTSGICDALDHATKEFGISGKLGIDACGNPLSFNYEKIDSKNLLKLMQEIAPCIESLHIYEHKNPIIISGVRKIDKAVLEYRESFAKELCRYGGLFVFVDCNEDLSNYYMLIWRIVNCIDVERDLAIVDSCVFLDATSKGVLEGSDREWPRETLCNKEVLETLRNLKLLEGVSEDFLRKFGI